MSVRRVSQSTASSETLGTKSSVAYMGSITRPRGTRWKRTFAGNFPVMSGGTESTLTIGNIKYRRHIFSSAGTATLTVSMVADVVGIYIVGGGGGGGAPADGFAGNQGLHGGSYYDTYLFPYNIPYTVTVGAGGTGAGSVGGGGGPGAAGGTGGSSTLGFVAGGGGGGGANGTPPAANGANLKGTPSPLADGNFQILNNVTYGLSVNVGVGGAAAFGATPGTPATNGNAGAVVVQYEVLT